ncbi:hypothetical protein GCM10009431_10350 [Gaetbulibacter jejuensis]|uniref:DUF6734 domain-containing protein n=2 Tax=Gaetbulibacter jejuensis TaxID=584607 RepID=A0ABN1JI47_9FLAO
MLNTDNQKEHGRFSGGWLDRKYHLMSWALSCLQLLEFYDEVELFTDEFGRDILIDQLQLPYTKVHLVFDDFEEFHPDLWALGKVFVYGLQKDPFIHVDSDVYIGSRFSDRIENATLISQNIEKAHFWWYEPLFASLKKQEVLFPKVIQKVTEREGEINAYNAGILGGNDISFFQSYSKAAIDFVMTNIDKIGKIDVGGFNTIYEQTLFYCLATESQINVTCLFETENNGELVDTVQGFTNFKQFPDAAKYIHLYGVPCKRSESYCNVLSDKLKSIHPKLHKRIESLCLNSV